MLTPFKATCTKTDVGMQVECQSRNFTIIIDEPEDAGGADTGMSPVEAQLCALGACQSIVPAAFAGQAPRGAVAHPCQEALCHGGSRHVILFSV